MILWPVLMREHVLGLALQSGKTVMSPNLAKKFDHEFPSGKICGKQGKSKFATAAIVCETCEGFQGCNWSVIQSGPSFNRNKKKNLHSDDS